MSRVSKSRKPRPLIKDQTFLLFKESKLFADEYLLSCTNESINMESCAGLIGIVVLYVKHFEARIIKASSRELSLLMLLGILLGFITVIVNIFRPSDVSCKLVYVLFCQSFCWIYGPLVVRTCRMYRIFNSAKNSSSQRLRFISQKSQVFFSFLIISGQVRIIWPTVCLFFVLVFMIFHAL